MADSKITALASISTSTDPAVDPLVIVDVSDTSMAATGTTKKVTLNNLLSSSPTATGAFSVTGLVTAGSATVTGDLTVDTNVLKVDTTNNRVGILTASPRSPYALDVLGNVALGDSTTTTSVRLKLDCLGTAGNMALMSFAAAGTNKVFLGLSGSFAGDTSTDALIATDTAGAGIRFYVADTGVEAMRLNSTANLVLKGGTVGANGVGVTFPATQVASSDANCLDDYEEGTFTPTVIGTTTAGVGVYSTQAGRYIKVGNLVTLQVYLNWTAHTGTGNMLFGNFPFTTSSTGYSAAAIGYASNIALTAGNILTAFASTSSTYVNAYQTPTGGGSVTDVPMDAAGQIIYTITYSV